MEEQEIAQFFNALYPNDVPQARFLLLWTLPGKFSFWTDTLDGACKIAYREATNGNDVYIGVGLATKTYGKKARVPNAQVAGIPGLWADIDYADDVHTKKAKLPSKEQALEFIQELPLKPTIVMHSGHGFQCWWAFHEPWIFASDQERELSAGIARTWIYKIRDLAVAKGWTVDSTIDLARVMRIPGTMNYKVADAHVPTSIVSIDPETRYAVTQFGNPSAPQPKQASFVNGDLNGGSYPEGTFALNPAAEPPMGKWMALIDNDNRALRTWKRERKDFTDQSPSTYDMSLASLAVAAGWSDQEIVDLLIASRRKHGDDLKLREDYYARTLARARRDIDTRKIEEEITERTAEGDHTPETALAQLSSIFGVELLSLVKYLGDPPTFVLTVNFRGQNRSVTLGDVSAIITQRTFRSKVAATVNVIIPKCSEVQWEKRAQLLLDAIEEAELGPESSPAESATQWLHEYLQTHKPSEDWEQAVLAGRPYVKDEQIYISLRNVAFWLRTVQGERITTRELARFMKMAGWEQYTQFVNATKDTPATTRSVWRRGALSAL